MNENPPRTPADTSSRARVSVELPPEFVDAVVDAVLERLAGDNGCSPASPYMTVDEAAEYLRCSRQRIYDLLSARRLTRHKDGSRVLVARSELDQHVAPELPHSPQTRFTKRIAA